MNKVFGMILVKLLFIKTFTMCFSLLVAW